MIKTTGLRTFALAAFIAIPVARAADDASLPLAGDLTNGAKRYRLDCAACHGLTGQGDGTMASSLNPKPTRLRDGAFLWSHTDEQIMEATLGTSLPDGAPMHGRHLSSLDARDILAWLKEPVLNIGDVFPLATDYIAHVQTVDIDGRDRMAKVMGRDPTDDEAKVLVFTVYRAEPDSGVTANGHPTKCPEEATSIYTLKPRRRIGFVTYQQLALAAGPLDVVMAMDNEARLHDVRVLPSDDQKIEKSLPALRKLLHAYVGTGGKIDKKPVEPHEKGLKAPKDVQAAMVLAFERLLEGEAMFLKEEHKRYELDPDAFNFPSAVDQPDNVKFDFKQKKQK